MKPDEVLRERARQLARPPADDDATEATTTLLRFRYAGNGYALELGDARQAVPLSRAARLPDVAWPLVAVGLVDGDIVPVLELSPTRGQRAGRQLPDHGIAIEADGMVLLVPADEVYGLAEVSDSDVSDVSSESDPDAAFVRGVTRQGDGLLDVRALVESVRDQRSPGPEGPGSAEERTDR